MKRLDLDLSDSYLHFQHRQKSTLLATELKPANVKYGLRCDTYYWWDIVFDPSHIKMDCGHTVVMNVPREVVPRV